MSKKWVIILSTLLGIVTVVLILFWTLFALSSVTVQFNTTKENLTVSDEEIVDAGQFKYGACVFFDGKKKYTQNIIDFSSENENFAYLKVLNIETKFPNKYCLHVAEREELFAVKKEGQTLICDRDFRVLKILETFESLSSNAIELNGLQIENKEIKIGDFLEFKQESMKKFYSAALQNNRNLNEIRGKFKSISLSEYEDEITHKKYVAMEMNTFQNRTFVINNIDFALTNKLQKLFAVESAFYSQNTDENGNILNSKGEIIYMKKNEKNEYLNFDPQKDDESEKVALNYALLNKCLIKIDNLTLTDYIDRTEKDIYYALVEK